MKEILIEIDEEAAKEFLIKILENSKFHFLKRIFDHVSNIEFSDNEIRFKVLMFKYYLKLKTYPKALTGRYEFFHNLPTKMIKEEELPKFVKLNDKTIIINIPENPISKNVSIEKLEIESGKVKLILGLN
ncbi:hypothetical protein Pmob_0704 [Petrotoga mobilis SJ95]|jgi:hypothetical protein|uniref:Uncharacterized protein n=1 Tax=Petrotoga mobilis (strain DSM 10674 / SJ95) TaxID=403833 RepID=A9BFT3_PETMO|nr:MULTISPECIES: hypothetical protein [Petrotoga]ABX31429.1 hypothetical protein Pmob_0704 [Petrotoga mobilis SJ95]MBL5981722.1 hypothetical protein [Petrotoga sp. 8T1HF07.NaAc.6.1]PNR92977.1 hypothetical protein X926_05205 [Petrotoga sp. HWHPT.55.6.3]RPD36127.1 hypothetical protein HWHPT5561_03085 [Petrotoga sp. HWH.PT.55.6.1]